MTGNAADKRAWNQGMALALFLMACSIAGAVYLFVHGGGQ
jgi:hypothetical protein